MRVSGSTDLVSASTRDPSVSDGALHTSGLSSTRHSSVLASTTVPGAPAGTEPDLASVLAMTPSRMATAAAEDSGALAMGHGHIRLLITRTRRMNIRRIRI